jgi:hypothetical protein
MLRHLHRCIVVAALTVPTAFTARSNAQEVDAGTRAVARDLGYAGVAAYERGDFAPAADKLGRAFKILNAPSLGLWSARALVKLGSLVQAAERYRDVGRIQALSGELAVQRQAQQDAARELGELTPRIPFLILLVEGAAPQSLEIALDDAPFPTAMVAENYPVNPGAHRLTARRGDQNVTETFSVAESEHKRVTLRFAPPLPLAAPGGGPPVGGAVRSLTADPSTSPGGAADSRPGAVLPILGWTALGLGAAGIATGAVTGLLALNERRSLEQAGCNLATNSCDSAHQGDVDKYNELRSISSVGFIAGGVLGAAGAVLLLTLPRGDGQVALRISPTAVTVGGAF